MIKENKLLNMPKMAIITLVLLMGILTSMAQVDATVVIDTQKSFGGGSSTVLFGNLTNVSQMADVTITGVANGEILTWSDAVGAWINSVISTASKWIIDPTSNFLYNDTDTLYFNETHLNITIGIYNDSIGTYVDSVNDSLAGWTSGEILSANTSIVLYTDSQDVVFNDSMVLYVDSQDTFYNESLTSYIDLLNSTGLIKDWNSTGLIIDWNDTEYIIDWQTPINAANSSMVLYVDSENIVFNDSMVLYVDSQDVVFNDSIILYVNAMNVSQMIWAYDSFVNITGDTMTGNLSAPYFKGLFNWTTQGNYLDFNGWNLTFDEDALNATIDSKIASTTYNATSIVTIEGTLDAGNIVSVNAIDNNWYNVSEVGGGSPLKIGVNFTGVTSFSSILLREQYTGGLGHEIQIFSWNYDDSAWEFHGEITDQDTMVESVINILDSSDHISGGLFQLKFEHLQNGNSNHDFFLDYVALQEGFTSITTSEHDGLLGRDSTSNHPWALAADGTRALTANWDAGAFNITAQWFLGIYNWIVGSGSEDFLTFNGTDLNFNGQLLNDTIEVYNNSMGTYIDSVNDSMATWTSAEIVIANTSQTAYTDAMNVSQQTWVDTFFARITNLVDLVGNWTADKVNYYTKSDVDTNITSANTSIVLYVDSENIFFNDSMALYVDSLNSTGLIIDYNSTGYIIDWNDSSYIINWNDSGYIQDWQEFITSANDSMKTYVDNTYLNLSGTNANQDVNIGVYDFYANDAFFDIINFTHLRSNFGGAIDAAGDPWTLSGVDFQITEELIVDKNITTEGIYLEKDTTNHRMYDNATCTFITGDTSRMEIC